VSLLRVLPSASPDVRRERRALRQRFAEASGRLTALGGADRSRLRAEAESLAILRARIGELTGAPGCCRTCAHRLPDGHPDFAGGHCCGGETAGVTSARELAPLVLAGSRLDRAPTARRLHGCLFRTPVGCTLTARDRPSLCVAYLCRDLAAELHARGVLPEVLRLREKLEAGVARLERALTAEGAAGSDTSGFGTARLPSPT
jgi:hypothetical protein